MQSASNPSTQLDRRTFVAGAAAVAVAAAAGSAFAAESSERGTWANGTYTGVGAGYMGAEIQAAVTLDDTGISAIEFADGCAQTYGIGTRALDIMPERIIAAQSVGVDCVSCATKSSLGVKAAVLDALGQAGADLGAWSVAVEPEDASGADPIFMEADTVILGGGGAGMAAALAAMEQGKSVLVVEKSDILGGNTARSEGHLLAGLSEYQKSLGIEDDLETMSNDYNYNSRWMSRPELVGKMLAECGPTFDWLAEVSSMPLSGVLITESYAGQSGILRSYEPTSGRASEFTVSMEEAVRANPLATVLTGIAGTSLVVEDGAVVGVSAKDMRTGQPYVFNGATTVLATGCFPGTDQEMRELYNVKQLYRSSGSPVISGDGHRMALDLGADTWHMGMVTVRVSNAFEYLPGRGVAMGAIMGMLNAGNGIVVNKEGRRLAAECDAAGVNVALGNALVNALPEGAVYVVMDEPSFRENLYRSTSDLTDETNCFDTWLEQNNCEAGGIAHASTVEELAERAGMDPDVLRSTVNYYNYRLSVDAGDEFARATPQPLDLEAGELYAMKVTQSYVCSSGGLWVNESMQVCDENHEPICGLYAAGNVAGGGMGEPYYHGGSVAWSMVSGRTAGMA